eukprot:scaffold213511_cov40-Prasinocladus_malaysianus.AAC.1
MLTCVRIGIRGLRYGYFLLLATRISKRSEFRAERTTSTRHSDVRPANNKKTTIIVLVALRVEGFLLACSGGRSILNTGHKVHFRLGRF